MASLTPLSKGLIGLAVVGAMASAVWHLGLKEQLGAGPTESQQPAAPSTPAAQAPPSMVSTPSPSPALSTAPTAPAAPSTAGTVKSSSLTPAENAEMGRRLLDSGDFAQARVHLEQAVRDGDGGAACHLGEMTLKGQGGIAANQEKSAALFQLAQSRSIICFASGK